MESNLIEKRRGKGDEVVGNRGKARMEQHWGSNFIKGAQGLEFSCVHFKTKRLAEGM